MPASEGDETRSSLSPLDDWINSRIPIKVSSSSDSAAEMINDEQKKEIIAINTLLDEIYFFPALKYRDSAYGYLSFDVTEMRSRILWLLSGQHKTPTAAKESLKQSIIAAIKGQELELFNTSASDHQLPAKITGERLIYCFPELSLRLVNTLPAMCADPKISRNYPPVMHYKQFGTMIPRRGGAHDEDVYEIIRKAYCLFLARLATTPSLRLPDEVELARQMPYILCDMKYSPVDDKTRNRCLRSTELKIFNCVGQPVKAIVQMAKRYDAIMESKAL